MLLLDEPDGCSDRRIKFDDHQLGTKRFDCGPSVVVVAIDIDRKQVRILRDLRRKQRFQRIGLRKANRCIQEDVISAAVPGLEVAKALRVALDQHAAIATRGDQVIGVAVQVPVPSTKLDTPPVFPGQQIQRRRNDAVLAALRRNVRSMLRQPTALFS